MGDRPTSSAPPHHRPGQPVVLFTAFEPSGDAHAAPVIRALRERVPELAVYAWGGPQMEAAGATVVSRTAEDGAMGLSALRRARVVRRAAREIREWSRSTRILAHVAVDSPAANFPICRAMRLHGARIVHLVAPQLWAWGAWRTRKLRRLTDLVLCLLPFEEQWFRDRGIPARFIGHPRMNRRIEPAELRQRMHGLPKGTPRVAIFPGSRMHEVRANIRLLVNVFVELQGLHAGMGGVIVAASPEIGQLVRRKIKVFPTGLHMVSRQVDGVIAWSDLCLAVSGTITMDICRQQKPMIGVYKTGLLGWLGAKLLVRTPWRLLPNIVAEREVVPEFVPYIGGVGPLVRHANEYLRDSKNAAIQSQELSRVCQRFVNKRPSEESARLILRLIKKGTVD